MCVIIGVAGNASCQQSLPALSGMARKAGNTAVRAGQGKAGAGMVKALNILPASGAVAVLARSPELAFVGILGGVARCTIARGSAVMCARPVAPGTLDLGVAADEREIGEAVNESCPVKLDEPESAALMLAVTAFARTGAGLTKFAMEMRPARNIAADAAVAGQALAVLRLFLE